MNGSTKLGRAAAGAALVVGVVSGSLLSPAQASAAHPPGGGQHNAAPDSAQQGQKTPRESLPPLEAPGSSAPAASQPTAPPSETAPAPTGSTTAPTETEASVVIATTTIQKIDKAGRKLILLGPDGQSIDVKAGPNVDLDSVHVGDRVNATYYEEVAVGINSHPRPGARMTTRTVQRGGVTARQATVTAHIVGVDTADDTVTVRTPDGKMRTVKVADPALQAELPHVRAGQDVDLTYTQAVAIAIEPAEEPARPEPSAPPASPSASPRSSPGPQGSPTEPPASLPAPQGSPTEPPGSPTER